MAKVSTYLNFERQTEEAFLFYQSVFGTEFEDGGFRRFSDIPPHEGMPALLEEDQNLIMHICLPILGGHLLMGTDAPKSMGFSVHPGNNVFISLHPDSRAESDKIFAALSAGGKVEVPLQEMFWGDYFASFEDKFGTNWMINCSEK